MGRPGDYVDGCGVQREIEDFGPGVALLAPDEDFAVVRGGGEDVAVFGVCPGDGPDCSFVSKGKGESVETALGRSSSGMSGLKAW